MKLITDKEKFINKLENNGFINDSSHIGLIVYSKQLSKKHIIFILKNNVFEKIVVQLIDNGSCKNIYRYSEFDDVKLN